jgi:hypothetical protein
MILDYLYADKMTFKAISEKMNIPMVSVDVIDYSAERQCLEWWYNDHE